MQLGKQIGKVGEPEILVPGRLLHVQPGELPKRAHDLPQFFRSQGVVVAVGGSHRRETNFVEAHLLQVPEALLHRRNAVRQCGAGRYAARLVVAQQVEHPGMDHVVGAESAFIRAPQVVILLRPVDADRDSDPAVAQKFDYFRSQVGGVRGHAEFHALARLASCLVGVNHQAADQRQIHQRLSAEKHQRHAVAVSGVLQKKIHAAASRRFVHHLARRSVVALRREAVTASQVAVVRHIEHEAFLGKGQRRELRRREPGRVFPHTTKPDRTHSAEFRQDSPDLFAGMFAFECGIQLGKGDGRVSGRLLAHGRSRWTFRSAAKEIQDLSSQFVHGEDACGRNHHHVLAAADRNLPDFTKL